MTRTPDDSRAHPEAPKIVAESPDALFREMVGEALAKSRVRASAPTEFYLVNLLTTFIDARRIREPAGASPTLVELLAAALEACPAERLDAFRRLGDFALFISGFFGESFARRAVDVDYYVAMGGRAYGQASRLAPTPPSREVFEDLSRRFVAFMDVIGSVGERAQVACRGPAGNETPLLHLYDRFLRTGSECARRKLVDAGLLPVSGLDTRYRQ